MKHNIIRLLPILIGSLMLLTLGCRKDDEDVKDKIVFNPTTIYGSVTDIDGNKYKTVNIDNNQWMAENLKTTHYSDGSPIPNVTDNLEWYRLKHDAYCWMNNDAGEYKSTYGALYNFYAVSDSRNVCPAGWHVPSYLEWNHLVEFLGGSFVAGVKLKEEGLTHWMYTNSADNSSGFTALPSGGRGYNGEFTTIGKEGFWWLSTQASSSTAVASDLIYKNDTVRYGVGNLMLGFSLRCIKDIVSIKTQLIGDIKQTTATSGGNIISKGDAKIVERGVCWSTNQNPTIADSKTSDEKGTGVYASYMTNLMPKTKYYVRAYASNGAETYYGNELSFTTLDPILPIVTTTTSIDLTESSATCKGELINDGGLPLTAVGICWSTLNNPTVESSNVTNEGGGIGTITSYLNGLTVNTVYYFRAYATNNLGTAYGDVLSFKTFAVVDIDGNRYTSVTIGNQVWMGENLNITRYIDYREIPYITDNSEWNIKTTSAFCWYNNDPNGYKDNFGALYNYYAIIDSRNICPTGWHVPSKDEWNTLITYLGGSSQAGGKLKATTLWNSPNTGADNSSGFSAFPGGNRNSTGFYNNLGNSGYWWTSTAYDASNAYVISLSNVDSSIGLDKNSKKNGYSVRCLKD